MPNSKKTNYESGSLLKHNRWTWRNSSNLRKTSQQAPSGRRNTTDTEFCVFGDASSNAECRGSRADVTNTELSDLPGKLQCGGEGQVLQCCVSESGARKPVHSEALSSTGETCHLDRVGTAVAVVVTSSLHTLGVFGQKYVMTHTQWHHYTAWGSAVNNRHGVPDNEVICWIPNEIVRRRDWKRSRQTNGMPNSYVLTILTL
jgi:hypothetical protein